MHWLVWIISSPLNSRVILNREKKGSLVQCFEVIKFDLIFWMNLLRALFAFLLCGLNRDERVSFLGDNGANFTTVRCLFVELFSQLEFQLHALQDGGGLEQPGLAVLVVSNLKDDNEKIDIQDTDNDHVSEAGLFLLTSKTGEEAVAAFLNMKLTPNSERNSSYLSTEVLSYFPRYLSASAIVNF